jgi:hypothetical protein
MVCPGLATGAIDGYPLMAVLGLGLRCSSGWAWQRW